MCTTMKLVITFKAELSLTDWTCSAYERFDNPVRRVRGESLPRLVEAEGRQRGWGVMEGKGGYGEP